MCQWQRSRRCAVSPAAAPPAPMVASGETGPQPPLTVAEVAAMTGMSEEVVRKLVELGTAVLLPCPLRWGAFGALTKSEGTGGTAMQKVSAAEVATALEVPESPLPPQIQEALGELVGAAREGLRALSVGVGLGVVHELMELEVDEVVGPRSKHNPDRLAKRHGHEDGSMTLGGRRVKVRRPRIRSADDEHELAVTSYEYFADRDPLTRAVMDRMLAGVSTRKFADVGEPVGSGVEVTSSSTSKTSVSDMFIERTRTALSDLMSRRLEDVRLAVMMLDGLEIADRTHVVALGITTEGVKLPLGLWEGSTENATLARALLADLVDRGLDPEQAILFVIDGGKALRRAIKDVFGEHALVHRCHRHKERNVTDLLPERDRPTVRARMRAA